MSISIILLGLIVGSFLNVVIYRLPLKKSIIFPSSHCPYCKKKLKYYDLIPVFSYVFTKGKCRYCGEKISIQYPIVELLTGLLFLLTFLKYGLTSEFIILVLLITSLIAVSFIDIKYQIIPNEITFLFIPLGLIFSLIFNHISFINSLLGLIIPAGILLLIALTYKKGMGIGDVKLIGMIGVFIGWKYALISIFIGALFGSIYGIYMMLIDKMTRKTRIPFGPFISLGAVLMILYGDIIINWYLGLFI
ncbi:MAG: prepilin peptidase [Halanaerobiales bacterium]|nr:prepilin peptidase [Halanaerobiales bacterium]